MKKSINLGISNFTPPHQILDPQGYGLNPKSIEFDTKDLFHHFWIMKYGEAIPPTGIYEYESFLVPSLDWRFFKSGIGDDKESKRNVSNELAKAFARWFLYSYESLTYFVPFESEFKEEYSNGMRWLKILEGDLPDYVCVAGDAVRLVEVKGRYKSVSFTNAEFQDFRDQISRVVLQEGNGRRISVKGYVSACQWATQETPKTFTKMLVEDPKTEGEDAPNGMYPRAIIDRIVARHYSPIFDRLMLPIYAEVLGKGGVAGQLARRMTVWQVRFGPLKGRRFVGGIIDDDSTACRDCCFWYRGGPSPFLRKPRLIFGLELHVFQQVVNVCLHGVEGRTVEVVDVPGEIGFGLTFLRDGTIIANEDLMEIVDDLLI